MSDTSGMRVLVVMPHLGGGGAERLMIGLTHELLMRGWRAEMFVMERVGERLEEADGIPVRFGWDQGGSLLLQGGPALWRAWQIARRVDIVVAGEDGAATGLAVLAARLARRPCVAMLHNDTAHVRAEVHRNKAWLWLMRRLKLAARAEVAVAVSQDAADAAAEERIPRSRIRVIENGIDVTKVEAMASEACRPLAELTVVGVGRLAPQKGFDLLIRAHAIAAASQPHRLVILGEGPERTALERLAAELGVAGSVELPGYVDNPFPLLRQASLFCLSSRYEGLPLVLLEALLLGVPIVATRCDGAPTALDDGRLGDLVPTEDADSLAGAILRHLKAPERLREAAAGGGARVRERYSLERAADEYAALFKEVVGRR